MKNNLDTRLYNEFGFNFTESMTVFEDIVKAYDLNIQMSIDEKKINFLNCFLVIFILSFPCFCDINCRLSTNITHTKFL